MPQPPAGEAELRDLAQRYAQAEGQILKRLAAATNGDRRMLLTEALELLTVLRRLDHRAPVVAAYLHEHTKGKPDAVRDLAASLHQRLYRGATSAMDGARQAFTKVAPDNLDDMAATATLAAVDRRGVRWSLSRWAEMNTQTIGRQATSRGAADRIGEGNTVTVNTGDCAWCASHAGQAVIGQDPLPPFHPNCSCVATAA
jgi:hypothetical protein